ncbi:MAG: efflux RND transporter permease subunit [Rhizomicrobium sp.]
MNISRIFIERPVMTTLLMAALVLFGAFGYSVMPVSELPSVDFPTITVSASLPGADPQTMASAVATPLESQFATIPGVSSITSQSSSGSTTITIQFDLGRNIDGAAMDVQSAIQTAASSLPTAMPTQPTLRKVNPADAPILFIAMSSSTLPLYVVDRFAENLLARQISMLPGVAEVDVRGAQTYAARIQVDPNKLAARGIGIDTVADKIQATNVNTSTGQIDGPTQSTLIRANGQLTSAAAFNQQIIAYRNGAPVRLSDVGHAVDSVQNSRVAGWYNGTRAIILSVQRQPGTNTIAIIDSIKQLLPQFEESLPKAISLGVTYDRSQTIRASISDVQTTLIISAVLVVLVIFVFLRSLSATIIPSLALPITVIGTFAGMSALGFSLDNLSLLALTLSVGFVVDDAIVMLENIVRHVEAGEDVKSAAFKGAREIGFTILSMTVSLAAVFIPLMFMGGILGRLLNEFAITIVLAIVLSGIVSITLTPLLCSRFISGKAQQHGRFYQISERYLNDMQAFYDRTLHWSLAHKRFILSLFFLSLLATAGLFAISPQDFIPTVDIDQISASTEASDRTSIKQMVIYQKKIATIAQADPDVVGVMSSVGSGGGRSGSNVGTLTLRLKPRADRSVSADEIIARLRPQFAKVPGVNVYMQVPPQIRIGGRQSKSQYQYTLQDLNQDSLTDSAVRLTQALKSSSVVTDVTNDIDVTAPVANVDIDRDKAAAYGITPSQIESALGNSFGGSKISTIYGATDQYYVMMELLPEYQTTASDINRLYLTASDGTTLVPLNAVTHVKTGTMPLTINHQGQLPAVTISFNLAKGAALSDAVGAIHKAETDLNLPATLQANFQGQAQAFQSSMGNMGMLIGIALITVYIILGILYESFIHPLTILSGLPSAAVGALIALYAFGIPLSLYAFVGMIMLIGIVKKNAIMMIDFALQRERGEGVDAETAITEAALVRFRPIMMTTMAALLGMVPVAIGFGAGGESRMPLGIAVVGGLLVSQLLTLYITPVIYIYLDRLGKHFTRT